MFFVKIPKIKEKVFLNMEKRKGFFKKGHQYSKGKGRPPGSVDSKRHLLTKLFLEYSEQYWPSICQTIFEEALKGNTKALLFVAEYSMVKPSQHIVCEATEPNEIDLDVLKNMSSDDLRALGAKIVHKHEVSVEGFH